MGLFNGKTICGVMNVSGILSSTWQVWEWSSLFARNGANLETTTRRALHPADVSGAGRGWSVISSWRRVDWRYAVLPMHIDQHVQEIVRNIGKRADNRQTPARRSAPEAHCVKERARVCLKGRRKSYARTSFPAAEMLHGRNIYA